MKESHMVFTSEEEDATFIIDYLDMLTATKLLIPNAESIDNEDKFIRDNYKYNVIIQIQLSALNGVSCITGAESLEGSVIDNQKNIIKRSNIPIAIVYMQLINEDLTKQKMLLENKQQEQICDYLLD